MKSISAEELDRLFDEGKEDVLQYFDLTTERRPNLEPVAMFVTVTRGTKLRLERRARELGVSEDALLEEWLREKLDAATPSAAE